VGKSQGGIAIPLQKLFVITIVVKVALSFFAWLFNSPWILGFWAPLGMMAAYIVIGFARSSEDVGDEKFGDSCYYLGFIFTISSIAFSLFDVPQLDQAGKLKDIAVRFGAAMVSTFFGIIVRIYLVGFRKDTDLAFDQLEQRLISATDTLRGRMDLSIESFRHFEAAVHEATKDVAARANMAFETLGKACITEFTASMSQVTSQAREVFVLAATQVQASAKSTTEDLRQCVRTLEGDFTTSLNQVTSRAREVFVLAAAEVEASAKSMTEDLRRCVRTLEVDVRTRETESHRIIADLQSRFDAIRLPDDFFSQKLEVPVSKLASTIDAVQENLKASTAALHDGLREAGGALEELRAMTKASGTHLAAASEAKEVLSTLATNMASAAQALVGSAQVIREQREFVAQTIGAIASKRQSDEETSQGLRSASQQLTAASSALQHGAEALRVVWREVAEARKGMEASPGISVAVRPAPIPTSTVVAAKTPAIQPVAAPTSAQGKTQSISEKRSTFSWKFWR